MKRFATPLFCVGLLAVGPLAHGQGATFSLAAADFGVAPEFSSVSTFAFDIRLTDPITPASVLNDPALIGVEYSVFGSLDDTPSGFPAFNLVRTIGGAEFYAQGSSLRVAPLAPTADLTDGLQIADLLSADPATPVFEFNGREVGTGRFHPSLLQIFSDGTGLLQNANNTGGVNPSSGTVVNVDFGDEFITRLTFDPAVLTLVAADAIPEPATAGLLALGALVLVRRRR